MAIGEDTKLEELERIKGELRELMPLLSKWRVEELRALVSKYHEAKWRRRGFRKYGSINKGFTQEELNKFLGAIKEPRYKLLFEYQAYLALRVGEVCKLNIKNFDFNSRELKVKTEKAHTLDVLLVPRFLFEETLDYVRERTKEIDNAQGYLFYTDKTRSHTDKPYFDLDYIRKVFRYYISLTGLNEVYDTTEETIPDRTKRRLHRLTTHSLRHFGITAFNRAVGGDIMLTKAFARHREVSSTQIYVHIPRDALFSAIDSAFPTNKIFAENKVNIR